MSSCVTGKRKFFHQKNNPISTNQNSNNNSNSNNIINASNQYKKLKLSSNNNFPSQVKFLISFSKILKFNSSIINIYKQLIPCKINNLSVGDTILTIWSDKIFPSRFGPIHCIYRGKIVKFIENENRVKIDWFNSKGTWECPKSNLFIDNEHNIELMNQSHNLVTQCRSYDKFKKITLKKLPNLLFQAQNILNSNQNWNSKTIFTTEGLTKDKLNQLLSSDREISILHEYSYEEWINQLSSNPIACKFLNLPIKVIGMANQIKSVEAKFKEIEKEKPKNSLNSNSNPTRDNSTNVHHNNLRKYKFEVSHRKIHSFDEDEKFCHLNLLNHNNENMLDKRLSNLQSYKSNIFYGTQSTQVGLHVDGTSGIGLILNDKGMKLFLFANFDEVQDNYESLFEHNSNLQIQLLRIDPFMKLKSYRWCVLAPYEYLYWPATSYHAVFNIENSLFISPTYIPALPNPTESWLEYILTGNHTFANLNVIQAVSEILRKNFKNKHVIKSLTKESILTLNDWLDQWIINNNKEKKQFPDHDDNDSNNQSNQSSSSSRGMSMNKKIFSQAKNTMKIEEIIHNEQSDHEMNLSD